ncbi:MAG: glycosyltransferase family 2 protein [Bacteroidota bacterium]
MSSSKPGTTAVVILNYNGREHLRTFLPSVIQHRPPNGQIYVADNGSTDDSQALLAADFPEVRILPLGQNWGFAEGYNRALAGLAEEFVVLLNSDVEVSANWLAPILAAMREDDSIGAAQPKILAHRDKSSFEYAGAAGGWIDRHGYPFCRGRIFDHLEKDEGQYDDPQEVFWASGCALVIRGALYRQIGGLDGDYFAHMEEIDLCWRIKKAGYRIVVFPQSVVYHLGGGPLQYNSPNKAYLNFRNSLYTLFKNEEGAARWWRIFIRLFLDGVAGIRFVTQGKFAHLLAIVRAHWTFFFRFGPLQQRREWERQRMEAVRRGPARVRTGRYAGSILWTYFVRGIKTFKQLV